MFVRNDERIGEKVLIRSQNKSQEEEFDRVIIATHSDQALKMLDDSTAEEEDILASLPYQSNSALLHSDESVLPSRKLAWSSWNYALDQRPSQPVALTYNMNILQGLSTRKTFCVTLNNIDNIDKNKIIKHLSYEHPLFTLDGIEAQKRKREISGINNTYYCGA